jgi:hypothetical protein
MARTSNPPLVSDDEMEDAVLAVEVSLNFLHLGMPHYIRNGSCTTRAGRLNRGTRPGQREIARVVGVQAELRNLALKIPLQRWR